MQCPVVSFSVPMGLAWLYAALLLMFRIVFLFCWRIIMVCLALDPVGSWLELAFFGVTSCVLIFPGVRRSLMFLSFGVKPSASGF